MSAASSKLLRVAYFFADVIASYKYILSRSTIRNNYKEALLGKKQFTVIFTWNVKISQHSSSYLPSKSL